MGFSIHWSHRSEIVEPVAQRSWPPASIVLGGLPPNRLFYSASLECNRGRTNGVSIIIFDCVYGSRGGSPYTLIACHTEQNPFGAVTSPVRVIQSHGWTFLYGVWFVWFSWLMSTRRLESYLDGARVRSVRESIC